MSGSMMGPAAASGGVAPNQETEAGPGVQPQEETVLVQNPAASSSDLMVLPAIVRTNDLLSHVDLNSAEPKSLGWLDKFRGQADLLLELGGQNRIFFITYDRHGNRSSASGWHGHWSIDTCNVTRRKRDRCGQEHVQHAGDEKLCLQGFRYCGDAAVWFHDMEFFRPGHSPIWEMSSRCSYRSTGAPLVSETHSMLSFRCDAARTRVNA